MDSDVDAVEDILRSMIADEEKDQVSTFKAFSRRGSRQDNMQDIIEQKLLEKALVEMGSPSPYDSGSGEADADESTSDTRGKWKLLAVEEEEEEEERGEEQGRPAPKSRAEAPKKDSGVSIPGSKNGALSSSSPSFTPPPLVTNTSQTQLLIGEVLQSVDIPPSMPLSSYTPLNSDRSNSSTSMLGPRYSALATKEDVLRCRKMKINIKSTWGDVYYVGLSAIEMWDGYGNKITLKDPKTQLRSEPSDVNILPGVSGDPRTIDKLVDGVCNTQDDEHVWLAPFSPGQNHYIYVDFLKMEEISMIRFWNYNKNRIHSHRGARAMEMYFDEKLVFEGELRKAPGVYKGAEQCTETILFTRHPDVVRNIKLQDSLFSSLIDPPSLSLRAPPTSPITGVPRPATAGESSVSAGGIWKKSTSGTNLTEIWDLSDSEEEVDTLIALALQHQPAERPVTRANIRKTNKPLSAKNSSKSKTVYPTCQKIVFRFMETWGDKFYMGLTSIELIKEGGQSLPISPHWIDALPRDIRTLPGCEKDTRTPDKLVDGFNQTVDDKHMWLIPFTSGGQHWLSITLPVPMTLQGVRIWNYNKSPEDTYRGVKRMSVELDGKQFPHPNRAHIIRKGPGIASFPFGQQILFSTDNMGIEDEIEVQNQFFASLCELEQKPLAPQDYEIFLLPCGYIYKFSLLSTWGDAHYIGLNGLELWDWQGGKIDVNIKNAFAVPCSVRDLPECSHDVRSLDKLFDGVNNTWNDRHMWLAPWVPGSVNHIYIFFDQPVAVSMVKFWNYSKTLSRGVQEFEMYIDDVLVYKGVLRMAPPAPTSSVTATDTNTSPSLPRKPPSLLPPASANPSSSSPSSTSFTHTPGHRRAKSEGGAISLPSAITNTSGSLSSSSTSVVPSLPPAHDILPLHLPPFVETHNLSEDLLLSVREEGEDFSQSILFTTHEGLLTQELPYVYSPGTRVQQHVQFVNNRKVMVPAPEEPIVITPTRPATSVVGRRRA